MSKKGKKKKKSSSRVSKGTINPEYEHQLHLTLEKTWGTVLTSLRNLQKFLSLQLHPRDGDEEKEKEKEKEKKENEEENENEKDVGKYWNREQFATCFKLLFDLCSGHDCIFYERELYEKYILHMEKYLVSLLPAVEKKSGEEMITYIIRLWSGFKGVYVKYCLKLLDYLNRYYVKNEGKESLSEIAYNIFKKKIYDNVSIKLNKMILTKIRNDRNDNVIEYRNTIHDGLVMFRDMDQQSYEKSFEKIAIEDTRRYYKQLSNKWLTQGNVISYFQKCKDKISREVKMLQSMFCPSSHKKLLDVCCFELLERRRDRLLNREDFAKLIREEKFKELNLIYTLYKRVPNGVAPIAKILQEYIVSLGKEIFDRHQISVQACEDHQKMVSVLVATYVDELIQIKEKLSSVTTIPFESDSDCIRAFSTAFKEFVNSHFKRDNSTIRIKAPQVFAYYCDERIRRNVENLEDKISKVVDFIQFFKEKDLFITEYKKQLAKRLLTSQYREEDEKTIVSQIKYRYRGISDIYKLEKMLSDKISSREMREQFKVYLRDKKIAKPFDIEVTVLKQGAWPIVVKDSLQPIGELVAAQDIFSKFYRDRNSSRILQWSYENSTLQLFGHFASGKKTIHLSTFQGVVLLLFNDNPNITISEVRNITKLRSQDLVFSLVSMSSKKYRVLIHNSKDRKWWQNSKTKLKINENFKHPKSRFKIPLPRVTEKSTKQTQENVNKDRSITVDAALVRIMKARRDLTLQKLIAETVNQIHVFNPTVKLVKQRIEYLVENEYLKRSDDQINRFIYIA